MDYWGKSIVDNWGLIQQGLVNVIQLTLLGSLFSLVVGTLVGVLRITPVAPLRWFSTAYVEFFRNTPLLIQMYIPFIAFPRFGILWSPFVCALVGLTVYTGAYVAEVVRAGILAISRGQMEAGRSLGLSYTGTMRLIILPQAFRIIVPPMANLFLALLKNTAVAGAITVPELLYQAEIINSRTFRTFEVYTIVGLLYIAMTLPLAGLANLLERRMQMVRTGPASKSAVGVQSAVGELSGQTITKEQP